MQHGKNDSSLGHPCEPASSDTVPTPERLARRLGALEALLRSHELALRARRDELQAKLLEAGVEVTPPSALTNPPQAPARRPRDPRIGRTV